MTAKDIRPLPEGQPDDARYEVDYRSTTAIFGGSRGTVRARNVIVSAGALGTMWSLEEVTEEDWDWIIDLNLKSEFLS